MRKRSGMLIMLVGVAIALVAGLMVLAMGRQAAAQQQAEVPQVLVVMAAHDVAQGTAIAADALMVQAFPADFVPQGAIPAPEQAVGKYTVTQLVKGQIVLASQLSATKRVGNLALSVPNGKVAVALPMTDLMSTSGGLKAGDHVDILLTLNLKEIQLKEPQAIPTGNGTATASSATTSGSDGSKNPITQTTLQNVEVLSVGEVVDDTATGGSSSNVTGIGTSASGSSTKQVPAIIVLLDHQDALVLKYAKDSGGVVDLALRAPDDTAQAKTDTVTIDLLFERFGFRRPAPVP